MGYVPKRGTSPNGVRPQMGYVPVLACLDVQGVAERAQGSFLDGFAEGRVGVDGAADVFQAGAHLDRLGEGGGEFGHALADGLPANDQVVVAASDDAYEAVF